MKLNRFSSTVVALAAGALLLTACGSDSNGDTAGTGDSAAASPSGDAPASAAR